MGASIEVDRGPKGGDRVVLSPPASLRDGARIKVQTDDQAEKPGQAPAGGKKAGPDGEKVSER